MEIREGSRLGPYQVMAPLGEGGMGVIYRAVDTRLERTVALKVLRPDAPGDPSRRQRLSREARAASALNHPHIVTVYDVGSEQGVDYIAMEYVEGEPLDRRLARGRLPLEEVLAHARGIAAALAAAHAAGIVHRDLKPANVMLTRAGQVKVLDFGLAKREAQAPIDSQLSTRTPTLRTQEGTILGTLAYMSPEQAQGRPVDARSDVFSFGVMLYELLCGERPFKGESMATLVSAILRDAPSPPRRLRPDTPSDLERVVRRCLEKEAAARHGSGSELLSELVRCEERLLASRRGLRGLLRKKAVVAGLVAVGFALVAGTGLLWRRTARARWVRETAIPEIERLKGRGDYFGAFRLGRQAGAVLPGDPRVRQLLEGVSAPIPIVTRPAGARVYFKGYATPDAPWELLGETPLTDGRVPYAVMRLKIEKAGFETYEAAPFGEIPFAELAGGITLEASGTRPAGMVRVPGGAFKLAEHPMVELGDYWLDRYEVTNREFKQFVDGGGYHKRELWPQALQDGDRTLSWDEAASRFRDTTGRPAPAGWALGSYPEGQDDFPVGGVSWYEAAAYCAFAGKSLPTVHHWYKAAAQRQLSDILDLSNFSKSGPAPVGRYQGLGPYGTYDMAGNVREWAQNAAADKRYALGGAWGEPSYMYSFPDARPPFERSPASGVRCARYAAPPAPAVLEPTLLTFRVASPSRPVPDSVFEAYRGIYSYARGDLKATVDATDDGSPHYRKERVSFAAAYGGERVTAYLYLPRNAAPPYQAVLWVPGGDAFFFPSSESPSSAFLFDFLPRSGRALVYPVFKGLYERHVDLAGTAPEWRDLMIQWSKDLGRTIDYLETRPDIDHERLAYYGLSSGAREGPVFTTIDRRFKAAVLLAGGIGGEYFDLLPEINVVNFAPRCRVPTLMINGRDDFLFEVEAHQRPLFRLLGAPEPHKRHALLPGGHLPPDLTGIMRELLDWLDRYLGPVQAGAASS